MPFIYNVVELFDDFELQKAMKIFHLDRDNFQARVVTEIVTPALCRINVRLGYEADATHLARLLEQAINRVRSS